MALETVNMQQSVLHSLQVRVASLEGKFVLSDYQKKKQAGEAFLFPPFYTHPNGYHVALRVDANGYSTGKGTHVSLCLQIVKGEHDSELKWPFTGRVTMTLLNQLENKNHRTTTVFLNAIKNTRVGDGRGCHEFIRHSALAYDPVRNTQFLKDDTLHFTMSVERI
jgi:hypothetical protein